MVEVFAALPPYPALWSAVTRKSLIQFVPRINHAHFHCLISPVETRTLPSSVSTFSAHGVTVNVFVTSSPHPARFPTPARPPEGRHSPPPSSHVHTHCLLNRLYPCNAPAPQNVPLRSTHPCPDCHPDRRPLLCAPLEGSAFSLFLESPRPLCTDTPVLLLVFSSSASSALPQHALIPSVLPRSAVLRPVASSGRRSAFPSQRICAMNLSSPFFFWYSVPSA